MSLTGSSSLCGGALSLQLPLLEGAGGRWRFQKTVLLFCQTFGERRKHVITATRLLRSFIKTVPLVLGAVFVLALQPARASTWNHSLVDSITNGDVGKSLSMAADA